MSPSSMKAETKKQRHSKCGKRQVRSVADFENFSFGVCSDHACTGIYRCHEEGRAHFTKLCGGSCGCSFVDRHSAGLCCGSILCDCGTLPPPHGLWDQLVGVSLEGKESCMKEQPNKKVHN